MQEEVGGSRPAPEVTPFAVAGMGARADQLPGAMAPAGETDGQQQKAASFGDQTRGEGGVDLDAPPPPAEASTEGEFPEEDAAVLLAEVAAGEEAERGNGSVGGGGGNRWPREETLALIRIRSEMDAAFRDASLKGPLWEDVSRKLAGLGYRRSAKKCREKFENVHKYHRRTREGRAGRHDGKSYKFSTQLEALHGTRAATIPAAAAGMVGSAGGLQPTPLNAIPLSVGGGGVAAPSAPPGAAASPAVSHPSAGYFSFSSNYNSLSASSGSSEEDHEPRKRKEGGRDAGGGGGGRRRKMAAFFEGLMRQVAERQEAMQQKLLDMIEKREQDRMVREEAWRRQEAARVTREHEVMAQEQEIAAARDATIVAFLQKVTGQTVPSMPVVLSSAAAPVYPATVAAPQPLSQLQQEPPPPPPPPPRGHQQQRRQSDHRHGNEVEEHEAAGGRGTADPASSRWPKSEVLALIKLRSGMESKYQDSGAKGVLWEEIAAGMRLMGYGGRSAKRCKEKWENINKYFKKVKDSGKKRRPEDAKTCPYFHELDALYRKKVLLSGAGAAHESEVGHCPPPASELALLPQQSHRAEAVAMSRGDGGHLNNGGGVGSKPDGNGGAFTEQARHSNGGTARDEGDEPGKETEDAMRGPADQRRRHSAANVDHDKMEETESDSMDLQEDEEDEDEEGDKKTEMEYRVEYHPRPAGAPGGNSFTAMVQ